jgi:hypothetical protein
MSTDGYSHDFLRELAGIQGIMPTDSDLETVQMFLTTILPALARIEAELPPGTVPVGERLPA